MVGCEAAGSLFAISHVQVPENASAAQIIGEWKASSLANMHAITVSDRPLRGVNPPSLMLIATGKDGSGEPVEAQLMWRVSGPNIYHFAVYGGAADADRNAPFFEDIKLPRPGTTD